MTSAEWPQGALYHSPLGLYPFQEESIAQDYLDTTDGGGKLVVWDTGTGKSHFAMRMAALHQEDALDGARRHDLTILVCEKGKIGEWIADFEEFTTLTVRKHYGPDRFKHLAEKGLPQVLVTTYETAKLDLVKVVRPGKGKRGERREPGPLFQAISDLSVAWHFDESGAKLGNRTSDLWKAYNWVLPKMKKSHPREHKVYFLTATPMERDWENTYSQCLLLSPQHMPLVKEFEEWFVAGRHPVYGTARYKHSEMHKFAAMVLPLLDRRRKTDPDIMAQFPKLTERASHVEMAPDQAALYSLLEDLAIDPENPDGEPLEVPGLWTLLRMVAGHPGAIAMAAKHGDSKVAKMLVDELGQDYFMGISSAKEKVLLERLDTMVKAEGQKVVVFTFFGQTILPILAESIRAKKMRVYVNHGGMTEAEQTKSRQDFRADPNPAVFLTSDAGARGINLPEATTVFEFESALTYANRTQRVNRIHRINSESASVTCITLVADGTVEVPIIQKMSERNAASDLLLGDDDAGEDFMSAAERKQALQIGRLSKPKKRKRAA